MVFTSRHSSSVHEYKVDKESMFGGRISYHLTFSRLGEIRDRPGVIIKLTMPPSSCRLMKIRSWCVTVSVQDLKLLYFRGKFFSCCFRLHPELDRATQPPHSLFSNIQKVFLFTKMVKKFFFFLRIKFRNIDLQHTGIVTYMYAYKRSFP